MGSRLHCDIELRAEASRIPPDARSAGSTVIRQILLKSALVGLCTLGCRNPDGNARRDVAATLARLRGAGLDARITVTAGDAASNLRQLRREVGPNPIIVLISQRQIAVDFSDSIAGRIGTTQESRTVQWGKPYLILKDLESAKRGAARGLTADLMIAGIIPPKPLPPLQLVTPTASVAPSFHGVVGAVLVALVLILSGYIAYRSRTRSHPSDLEGGAG